LAENGNQVLRRYLEEMLTAERMLESQLREFASAETDDSDVHSLLAGHADQTHTQQARLAERLERLGGGAGLTIRNPLAALFHHVPQLPHVVHTPEERSLRNLLTSYTGEAGEIAIYEALANVARAAGDPETEALAREIQNEERVMAERVWHLLPSRAKIAFNMLTVTEIDPAVETKMADDRLGS
jgi:ferritin-like metal-binding protein YciE